MPDPEPRRLIREKLNRKKQTRKNESTHAMTGCRPEDSNQTTPNQTRFAFARQRLGGGAKQCLTAASGFAIFALVCSGALAADSPKSSPPPGQSALSRQAPPLLHSEPPAKETKAAGIPVVVVQVASACFSAAVHVNGLLAPRAEAVVVLTQEGYQVAEVLAAENDLVSEGQPLARLTRIGAEAGTAGRTGANLAAALPASIILRAPADGRVIKSNAMVGAASSPRGEPLFRLAIEGLIEVDAEVSSIYLSEIKEDQTVLIETEGGAKMIGQVRKVASEINPATQMGHVRVKIDRDPSLRAGGLVRATIDARKSCGIAAPASALFYGPEGTSVQVVRGGQIETLRVRVGLASDHEVEITEGLRAGELVVANAGDSLSDGDEVYPVFSEDAADPKEPR